MGKVKLENISMRDYLAEKKIGDYSIEYFEIVTPLYAITSRVPIGKYVSLRHKGELLMSDTHMEKRTNKEFVENAKGDILIAGLGLGMIVVAIQDKPEVKTITIVEKSKEVIDLITSQIDFNSKVKIVEEDIYEYQTEQMFDMIYFDIWSYVNSDIYREMEDLKERYSNSIKKGSLVSENLRIKSWAEEYAREDKKLI